jgi:hypothetical protein
MDTMTLLFFVLPLLMGLVTGAFKFMKLVGFLSGGARRNNRARPSYADNHQSFDERVAEKLRELESQRR